MIVVINEIKGIRMKGRRIHIVRLPRGFLFYSYKLILLKVRVYSNVQ